MTRSEKMILKKTDEIDKWLNEATKIYDQALYHFRQEFFRARDNNDKPHYDIKTIYKSLKESNAWKESTLDYNAKQYIFRKVQKQLEIFLCCSEIIFKMQSQIHWKAIIAKISEE